MQELNVNVNENMQELNVNVYNRDFKASELVARHFVVGGFQFSVNGSVFVHPGLKFFLACLTVFAEDGYLFLTKSM